MHGSTKLKLPTFLVLSGLLSKLFLATFIRYTVAIYPTSSEFFLSMHVIISGLFIQVQQVLVAGTNSSPCAPLLLSPSLSSLMALQSKADLSSLLHFSQSALFFELTFQSVTVHLLMSVCTQFHHLLFGHPHSGLP